MNSQPLPWICTALLTREDKNLSYVPYLNSILLNALPVGKLLSLTSLIFSKYSLCKNAPALSKAKSPVPWLNLSTCSL